MAILVCFPWLDIRSACGLHISLLFYLSIFDRVCCVATDTKRILFAMYFFQIASKLGKTAAAGHVLITGGVARS